MPRLWAHGIIRYRVTHTVFRMTDEGEEDHGDIEWDDDSYCCCPECNHDGIVAEFRGE